MARLSGLFHLEKTSRGFGFRVLGFVSRPKTQTRPYRFDVDMYLFASLPPWRLCVKPTQFDWRKISRKDAKKIKTQSIPP